MQSKGKSCPNDKIDVDDNAVIGADTAYSFPIHFSKGRGRSASA